MFGCFNIKSQVNLNQGGNFNAPFCDTIPFEYIRGKIVIPVEIHQKVRKFIFDTGAPLMIFESLWQETGTELYSQATGTDAVGSQLNLDITKVESFEIGTTKFQHIPAVILKPHLSGFLSC